MRTDRIPHLYPAPALRVAGALRGLPLRRGAPSAPGLGGGGGGAVPRGGGPCVGKGGEDHSVVAVPFPLFCYDVVIREGRCVPYGAGLGLAAVAVGTHLITQGTGDLWQSLGFFF